MPSDAGIADRNRDPINVGLANVHSVTELSLNIKQFFSATPQFNDILLRGEISNFVQAASGHIYFNLRDESSTIACAFLRHFQMEGCGKLCDGMQVVTIGSLMVYEPRSQYQLGIKKIVPLGNGIFSQKLKHLSEKLEVEGLFSQDRKKPIPCLPRKVGIITSKNSVAIKDILTVVNARCPKMDLVMAYVTLQGNDAPSNMILALSSLAKIEDIDAIMLARGGGPSEDFMAFNDEELVRAIASSAKPIVTGIGHESDVCLADLAADFRASTPSTAARAAIPDTLKLEDSLNSLKLDLERSFKSYSLALDAKKLEVRAKKYQTAMLAMIVVIVLIMLILFIRG